jgi:hypothetical protein
MKIVLKQCPERKAQRALVVKAERLASQITVTEVLPKQSSDNRNALVGQRHFPRRRCRKSCVVIGVGYVGGRGRRQELIRVTSIPNASSSAIRDFRWDTRACAFRDW